MPALKFAADVAAWMASRALSGEMTPGGVLFSTCFFAAPNKNLFFIAFPSFDVSLHSRRIGVFFATSSRPNFDAASITSPSVTRSTSPIFSAAAALMFAPVQAT